MKLAMAVAVMALLVFAWMFRYDVSGHVSFGDPQTRPVMLDRWTGKTYIYYVNAVELRVLGKWAEVGLPSAPWEKYLIDPK